MWLLQKCGWILWLEITWRGAWSVFCVTSLHILQWIAQCIQYVLEGGRIQGQKEEEAAKLLPYSSSGICGYKWCVPCFILHLAARLQAFSLNSRPLEMGMRFDWQGRIGHTIKSWKRRLCCPWDTVLPNLPPAGMLQLRWGPSKASGGKVVWTCIQGHIVLLPTSVGPSSQCIKPTS